MLEWFPYLDLPTAVVAVWLLAEGSARGGWIARWFGAWPLAQVGVFSYSLYLMHMPILAALLYFTRWIGMEGMTQFTFLCTVGTVVMLAGTYGFFLLFERPFLSQKAPVRNPRPSAAP